MEELFEAGMIDIDQLFRRRDRLPEGGSSPGRLWRDRQPKIGSHQHERGYLQYFQHPSFCVP
jgi:hypothetical protein